MSDVLMISMGLWPIGGGAAAAPEPEAPTMIAVGAPLPPKRRRRQVTEISGEGLIIVLGTGTLIGVPSRKAVERQQRERDEEELIIAAAVCLVRELNRREAAAMNAQPIIEPLAPKKRRNVSQPKPTPAYKSPMMCGNCRVDRDFSEQRQWGAGHRWTCRKCGWWVGAKSY